MTDAAEVMVSAEGGYRFIRGGYHYAAGVAAEPGFEIERARFARPITLAEGFDAIEAHLRTIGRPLTALCSSELRSPAPFVNEAAFVDFNKGYVAKLEQWKLFSNGLNSVTRCNVCPAIEPPASPSYFAFCYTVPARLDARSSFVTAGSSECPGGKPNYHDYIIRRGDTSPDGIRKKARWVHSELERRIKLLGFEWAQATATQLYTLHDVFPFMRDELAHRGAAGAGFTWYFARPPINLLEYEMDVRRVTREIVL